MTPSGTSSASVTPIEGARPRPKRRLFAVLKRPTPRVALAGVWADPVDPRNAHGIPYNLAPALARIGVYEGYREVAPPWPLLHLVRRWSALPGRRRMGGSWELGSEMRMLWAASDAARRMSTPRDIDGWVLMGPVRAVGGRFAIVTDQSPHQFFHRAMTPSASHWSPNATRRQLTRRERRTQAIYREAHACCVASRWAAQSLVADDGVDPRRVHVVGLGPGPGYEAPDPEAIRQRCWATPRFLFVGWDWERKNGDALVRAFSRVRSFAPDATLHLVGQHPRVAVDGVVAHGPLSRSEPDERMELSDLFARATCLVLPSHAEPFGHVHVEAAAAGLPSIGTSVGGAVDAIGPGGLVVDPDDERALVDAMRRMCDPATAASFGESALRYAELLTWDAVAQRIVRSLDLEVPGVELAEFL